MGRVHAACMEKGGVDVELNGKEERNGINGEGIGVGIGRMGSGMEMEPKDAEIRWRRQLALKGMEINMIRDGDGGDGTW
jgi:hypothetical protein